MHSIALNEYSGGSANFRTFQIQPDAFCKHAHLSFRQAGYCTMIANTGAFIQYFIQLLFVFVFHNEHFTKVAAKTLPSGSNNGCGPLFAYF